MNKMDPDDDEEDEDGSPVKGDKHNYMDASSGRTNSNSIKNAQVSEIKLC